MVRCPGSSWSVFSSQKPPRLNVDGAFQSEVNSAQSRAKTGGGSVRFQPQINPK